MSSAERVGRRGSAIDERKYLAELNKLLAFMSSWDREAVLRSYEDRFDKAEDPYALMEELGTPTRVAVELANGYVSSPPPADVPVEGALEAAEQQPGQEAAEDAERVSSLPAEEAEPVAEAVAEPEPVPETAAVSAPPSEALPDPIPETQAIAEAVPEPAPEPVPELAPEPVPKPFAEPELFAEREAPRPAAGPFVKLLYWLFTIVVGIPVTVLAVCLGLPFLSAGAWVIYTVCRIVPPLLNTFKLFSDTLLLGGTGLIALAAGLLLAWFGLWLSIALSRLWIGKVLMGLGSRVMGGD